MKRRPLIIDCDTGTDDAIALMAAFYCKDVEVVAVTSVNGNVPLQSTSANNLNLVEYLDQDEIPVAKGAAFPFYPRGNYYDDTHGKTGLGTVVIPGAKRLHFSEKDAARLIYEEAVKQGGELELLVIGPMTNIAVAYTMYPEIRDLIRHIWFMGGAVRGGNVSTTAEFNIWVDPAAAKLVIDSGIPMTMVGLDVTEKAIIGKPEADVLRGMGTKASVLAADLLEYMFTRWKRGGEDAMMHDALALAAAVCPECLTCHDYFVDVECDGTYTAGHTMVDVKGRRGKEPNVSVAMGLDLDLFREWLLGCYANSQPG